MIIDTLILENIRSYISQEFNFKSGINVLFGDIGSGKSTVLQAIEIALFGLKKGEGNHILRKGEKIGSIQLVLENKNSYQKIEIMRTFKKTSQGVTQSGGSIKIDENIEELSTQELNAFIFKYFNFPMSFVSKDKTLMYRFTHYTPQEQLKEILTTSFDKRLEILRKVFNIDNYKQLQNAFNLTHKDYSKHILVMDTQLQSLNDSLKQLLLNYGDIQFEADSALDIIVKKEENIQNEILELNKKEKLIQEKINIISQNKLKLAQKQELIKQSIKLSKEIEIDIEHVSKDIELKQKQSVLLKQEKKKLNDKINLFEETLNSLQKQLKELSFEDSKLKILEQKLQKNSKELIDLEKQDFEIKKLEELEIEITKFINNSTQLQCKIKDIEVMQKKNEKNVKKFNEIKDELNNLEEKISKTELNKKELEFKISHLKSESDKLKDISNLSICPTCFQKIDDSHKQHHNLKLKNELQVFQEEFSQLDKNLHKYNIHQKTLIEKIDYYEKIETEAIEKSSQLKLYQTQLEELNENLNLKKSLIKSQLNEFEVKSIIDFKQLINGKKEKKNELQLQLEKEITLEKELKLTFDSTSLKIKEISLNLENSKQNLELKNEREKEIILEDGNLNKKLKQSQLKLTDLKKDILTQEKIDLQFNKQLDNEKLLQMKLEQLIAKLSSTNSNLEILQKEKKLILENLNTQKEINSNKKNIQNLQLFLREDMTSLCKLLEETLLREIHLDLSLLIRNLFLELVDDKELEVYLRDDFSLIVEQNGFEVEVEQLSGGEKSALALSYRLALKKVIEKHFKFDTNLSYIMLDEPTDGFSQEQIQKFASILKSSEFEQIFLVSHDSNLLTSGEYTFTIEKENHISKLI